MSCEMKVYISKHQKSVEKYIFQFENPLQHQFYEVLLTKKKLLKDPFKFSTNFSPFFTSVTDHSSIFHLLPIQSWWRHMELGMLVESTKMSDL